MIRKIELFNYFHNIYSLSIIEFKKTYSLSLFGILWAVISPLIQIIVLTFVFTYFLQFNIPNYPVYLASGILSWQLMTTIIKQSSQILVSNRAKILEIDFPYTFHLTCISLVEFFRFSIGYLTIQIALSIVYGFSWYFIFGPLMALPLVAFSAMVGFCIGCFTPRFRDLSHILDVLINITYWSVPIFYSIDLINLTIKNFYNFHFIYWFIKPIQQVSYYHIFPTMLEIIQISCAIVVLIIATRFCRGKIKYQKLYL